MTIFDFFRKKQPDKEKATSPAPSSGVSVKKTVRQVQSNSAVHASSKTSNTERNAPALANSDLGLRGTSSPTKEHEKQLPKRELWGKKSEKTLSRQIEVPLSVTDTEVIKKNIQISKDSSCYEMSFYCPVLKAHIFCHSILIDKLGDLTKFIISSLYKGHPLTEIESLTQMGSGTVQEELNYLIRGGLICQDQVTLTDLGKQYGALLERFSALSEGIAVIYNAFADIFETEDNDYNLTVENQDAILDSNYIPVLARNENYANSLEIAKKQLQTDIPFLKELIPSLYTTVSIHRNQVAYKAIFVRDFTKGYGYKDDTCIGIAIPYEKITVQAHYKWLDPYRNILPSLAAIAGEHDELFTEKARALIYAFKEEQRADMFTLFVDTLTGEQGSSWGDYSALPTGQNVYVAERQAINLTLKGGEQAEIYLSEISHEPLYKTRYFPYRRMEM